MLEQGPKNYLPAPFSCAIPEISTEAPPGKSATAMQVRVGNLFWKKVPYTLFNASYWLMSLRYTIVLTKSSRVRSKSFSSLLRFSMTWRTSASKLSLANLAVTGLVPIFPDKNTSSPATSAGLKGLVFSTPCWAYSPHENARVISIKMNLFIRIHIGFCPQNTVLSNSLQ